MNSRDKKVKKTPAEIEEAKVRGKGLETTNEIETFSKGLKPDQRTKLSAEAAAFKEQIIKKLDLLLQKVAALHPKNAAKEEQKEQKHQSPRKNK